MTPKKMADALQTYAEWCGGVHDDLCPEDDTCECSVKWVNDGVNAAVNYLRGVEGKPLLKRGQKRTRNAMKNDKFFGDVQFDVWNAGGNPDLVDRDRVDVCEQNGADAEEVARLEVRLQRARADVARDMREWEANEWDLPENERFCR